MKPVFAETYLDASGACGSILHYAFILTFVGTAFIIFLYLWKKDKLDMDEEPKHKMMEKEGSEMNQDSEESGQGHG